MHQQSDEISGWHHQYKVDASTNEYNWGATRGQHVATLKVKDSKEIRNDS